MTKPTVTILTEDLFALADCRRALADLVHVLEAAPDGNHTTADLREGYHAWRDDALARGQVALEVTEQVALPDSEDVPGEMAPVSVPPPGPPLTRLQRARRLRVVDRGTL